MSYLDHPVFICGHRKSGTTMLINLFDGARDFVVYPDDSGFFYLYFPRYSGETHSLAEKTARLCDVLIDENLTGTINALPVVEEKKADLLQRARMFKEAVGSAQTADTAAGTMLRLFIDSFRQAFLPEMAAPKGWFEKTTSTEIYALELSEMFPGARFIHLLRDPRDNWASLYSGWRKRYQSFNDEASRLKQSMIERGRLGMEMASRNREAIGAEAYRVVRFEDLTSDPENVMRDLAAFAGMDFSDNLLVPTVLGFPWKGNNFEGLKFTGPSAVNVGRWRERISEEDAMLMEFHFRDVMEEFGYAPQFPVAATVKAAAEHYKWFNFSTPYSAK